MPQIPSSLNLAGWAIYWRFFCLLKVCLQRISRSLLVLSLQRSVQFSHSFYIVWYSFVNNFFLFFFCLLGLHLHMEAPRWGVEEELPLPAYTTATATPDPSRICDPYHSPWQHWTDNPLNKARDRTRVLMGTNHIPFSWATVGTPWSLFLKWLSIGFGH